MNYLSVENLSKRYGEKLLFENISFGIDKGQKVALVARNGTGKSSLLNVLAGNEAPETGSVVYRNDLRVSFLPQEPQFESGQTVLDTLFSSDHELVQVIKEYQRSMEEEDTEAMQSAFEKLDRLNGWDFEVRARQIFTKLKTGKLNQKVDTLSGGQLKRLALAHVLIDEPDLLILDEPTNHLDLTMIEWLEEFLGQSHMTLFMVTHDRYFLDRICNEIIEIDQGTLYKYKGNYSYFLQKRNERYQVQASEVEKSQNLLRKELDWMRRQPKARGTKSKSRIDSFYDLKDKASQKASEDKIKLTTNMERLGSKILELHNIKKQYDDNVLIDGLNHKFARRERIGIVGPNGAGKSTLLNMIMGLEKPTGGKIVVGETVKFGYYHQSGIKFKPGQRVIEAVTEIAEFIPTPKGSDISAAQLLERFLFPRSMHYNHIEKLSGGEKRRLYLLQVLMKNPNFLILDEPTNDLDILTLNVLEDYLVDFQGCLLIVTHDRYFMDKLVDHLFVFEGNGQIRDYPGNYSQYRKQSAREEAQKKKEENKQASSTGSDRKEKRDKPPQEKKKLSYKEKREFEQLTEEIEKLETEKAELSEAMNSGSLEHDELRKKGERLEEIMSDLEEKEMRWLELSEYV
ncbi:ABC-F family ATP-binding cassette domain-containing protein [Salibacter halophilus]|uniref:ABC-F family ATP-binding cassette domain-containing protein n=1 Tax=Salibacter halophilus TaxID=1803916 RepID=A0A6N6M6W3_9FLAO|nr:ABC-F family ATP-binding cassette domain-containing protein [Salibacter halophilus]KAB1064069.1 ABC-F family ATP-binding cassette domain-containing protein [Salibacter halophilus]